MIIFLETNFVGIGMMMKTSESQYYALQGLKRSEILDFMERDLLHRRLQYFEINHNEETIKVEDVVAVVQNELSGAGCLLGYRAIHKNIRQEYDLKHSPTLIRLTYKQMALLLKDVEN